MPDTMTAPLPTFSAETIAAVQSGGHYGGDIYHYNDFSRPDGFAYWLNYHTSDADSIEARERQIRAGLTSYINTMALHIYYEALNMNAAQDALNARDTAPDTMTTRPTFEVGEYLNVHRYTTTTSFRESLAMSDNYPFDSSWTPAVSLSIWNEAHNENDAWDERARNYPQPLPEVDPVTEVVKTFEGTMSERNTARLRELVSAKLTAERAVTEYREQFNRDLENVQAQLRLARAEITNAADPRLSPLWEQAHEAANDAGYCSEFDRMMEEIGAPPRSMLYRVIVRASVNAYVFVEASNVDDAQQLAEERFSEALENVDSESEYDSHEDGSLTAFAFDGVEADSAMVYE